MKTILSLAILACSFGVFGQSIEDKRFEHAMFEYRMSGTPILKSEFGATEAQFGESDYLVMEAEMFEKEGIYRVDLSKNKWNVTIYHWGEIKPEDLEQFFEGHSEKVVLLNTEKYSFEN